MDALICNMCGDTTRLDRQVVVAAAEILTFVEAHCVHHDVSIEFCDSGAMQDHGSFQRPAPYQDG